MKDERLYMTFPIDMHRHPKLTRLSVAAKWAFVEMNGEARIADNDGVFTVEEAEFLWPVEVLDELVRSHPTRPLVQRDGDRYVLREFAKHQQTRAEREELRAKRVEAGRKGGLAKSQASAKHALGLTEQTQAQSESESKSELLTTDVTYEPLSVTEVDARASNADATVMDQLSRKAHERAAGMNITNLPDVRDWLEKATGRTLTLGQAVELAGSIIARAKSPVESGDRYVIGTCRKSPARVSAYADELDLEVVA
jgi:hypothetical protein